MADTMRSISVLVAASIAYTVKGVSPEIADSTAAVFVSVIIVASLGPLIIGLLQTYAQIQEHHAENIASGRKDYSMATLPWSEQFQHLPSLPV